MITRITNFILGQYQGFSIDKSLIKKLYSYKPPRGSQMIGNTEDENNEGFDKDQLKIKKSISKRQVFSYSYSHAYWVWFIEYVYCLCCWVNCACCKRKRRMSKDEKLFRQGRRRLYAEIDLLDLVKQLRISKFMSSFLLNHNQRELVKFMN